MQTHTYLLTAQHIRTPLHNPVLSCRVEIVTKAFEGKRLVQRHQMMYQLLDDEIKAGVHALSMDTKTPKEVGMDEQ